MSRTSEMQLLVEPVARFNMLADAGTFRSSIWTIIISSEHIYLEIEEDSYCEAEFDRCHNGALESGCQRRLP